jgi:molybdopterin/thiamine biosynthesis adenylyltransferase
MIDALDRASLEQFQLDLVVAGFEPVDPAQREWKGPISESLRPFTPVGSMRIIFFDGWPFRRPRLFVEEMAEEHVNAGGEVCLWASGATSNAWRTLASFLGRIDEWARRAADGFLPEDFALDAHRYFGSVRLGAIATVNVGSLVGGAKPGGRDEIAGSWEQDEHVFKITHSKQGEIEGRWYFVGKPRVPPRILDEVRSLLDAGQQKNFDRRCVAIAQHEKSGFFMLVWEREFGQEVLVLLVDKYAESIIAQAIEVAPTDSRYLKLRAGRDVELLASKTVVVFGAGAIGSNVAIRLAEAGLGHLVCVDDARLRPADVVRHAGHAGSVGCTKAQAIETLAHGSTPWTTVTKVEEAPWGPTRVRELLADSHLVVDATGDTSFAALLSVLCRETDKPVISAALYRGGAVGRVRRQALPRDVMISDRGPKSGHAVIPAGDEPIAYEPGCSAPVNNASPITVAAVAALAADIVIDFLSERFAHSDEVIEIYRPLEQSPFDKVGRVGA